MMIMGWNSFWVLAARDGTGKIKGRLKFDRKAKDVGIKED